MTEQSRDKKYYVGGSLFTTKQIKQRREEADKIYQNLGGDVYNPIDNDEINDKTGNPTALDIFVQDTNEILTSDIILADLDDDDVGLAMELGIAFMCNYMRGTMYKIIKSDNPTEVIANFLDTVPSKKIYATCSDIRQDTEGEEGIYKSWGVNQYLVGGIQAMGEIHRDFEQVIESLLDAEKAEKKKGTEEEEEEESESEE